jgi:DNA-binding FadR family transcriptional regulator
MADLHDVAVKPDIRTGELGVRRVRKAYEQVYDQLQAMILGGELPQGHRLASEPQLASEFGVSRGTIREALRLLLAEGLIRTAKGAGGGSFVTIPTVDHVSEFLQRNLELLSLTEGLSLEEFLETRALIEIFAVRQAAMRRTAADVDALRATLTSDRSLSPEDQYLQNKGFHIKLVESCQNRLLTLSAQPSSSCSIRICSVRPWNLISRAACAPTTR